MSQSEIPRVKSAEQEQQSNDPVLKIVGGIREDLFTALGEVMGEDRAKRFGEERRWALCGPASIALTRIINHRTGIPISRNAVGPRLELAISLFSPKDSPKKIDHTYIRYYPGEITGLGKEIVWSIDPIHEPLFQGKGEHGKIIVERHTTDTIDSALEEKYSLVPFSRDPEYFKTSRTFVTKERDETALPDLLGAFHDERITEPYFIGDSGELRGEGKWSLQVAEVIQRIEPGWARNHPLQRERTNAVVLFDRFLEKKRVMS